jgi:hypothetical protein
MYRSGTCWGAIDLVNAEGVEYIDGAFAKYQVGSAIETHSRMAQLIKGVKGPQTEATLFIGVGAGSCRRS